MLSGSLASRDDPSGLSSYTFGRPNPNKRALRRDNRDKLSKRLLTSGNCNGPQYLPLAAIPVDIPAILDNNYIGFGSYSVTLRPTAPLATSSPNPRRTVVVRSTTTVTEYSTTSRVCDGSKYPQPCHHYSSVAQFSTYQKPTCAIMGGGSPARPLPRSWDNQHDKAWSATWITKTYVNPNNKRVKPNCQRDEWPPAHFQQGRPDGYIRLLPGSQNSGVANSGDGGWSGFCKYPPDKQVKVEGGPIQFVGNVVYTTIYTSTIFTLNVMNYIFTSMDAPANDRWLLTANPCYPSTLTQDPGFALLTSDLYYGGVPVQLPYTKPPTAQYTMGKKPPTKRQLAGSEAPEFVLDDSGSVWVEERNKTRPASDSEMLQHLGLFKCATSDCAAELKEWEALERQLRSGSAPETSWTADTVITGTGSIVASATGGGSSPASSRVVVLASPTPTMEIRTATAKEKIIVTSAPLESGRSRV